MRGRPGERGAALVAALVLQLVLVLAVLHMALAAVTARLATARGGALMQAEELARAAVGQGLESPPEALMAALAAGGSLPVMAPPGSGLPTPRLTVRDDEDGDDDPLRDRNGRLLLEGLGEAPARLGLAPSRALLVQEVWPGGAVPLPGALIDCAGGLAACGGEAGCPLPPSRLEGGEGAAVARPRERGAALRLRLLALTREVLRDAHGRCLEGACGAADEDLWRAAASAVRLRIEGPGHDAVGLDPEQVARLVSGLLVLTGGESGPGETPWWDGTLRTVPDRSALVAALESLALSSGHVPDLSAHPYPAVLAGAAEWADSEGLCRRLPALLEAAAGSGAGPAAGPVTVWGAGRVLEDGVRVGGEGLLVIRGPVRVAASARLEWVGSVVLAGGGVTGPGRVTVSGSVVILPPAPAAAVDLSGAGWRIAADGEAHRRAWAAAGNVAAASWWPLEGE